MTAPGKVSIAIGGGKGPDGSWWMTFTHQAANMSFTWGIPLETAETDIDGFAAAVKVRAAELRRQQSGLIVADATDGHIRHNGRR